MPGNGWDQEVLIPTEFVRSVILPAVEHEIGHIVAAAHFGAVIFGIGVGFIPERSTDGMLFQAIYGWKNAPQKPSASSRPQVPLPICFTEAESMTRARMGPQRHRSPLRREVSRTVSEPGCRTFVWLSK